MSDRGRLELKTQLIRELEADVAYAQGRRRELEGIVSRFLEGDSNLEELRQAFRSWCAGTKLSER